MKEFDLNPKTSGYYLIPLFVSGVCGYIYIGNLMSLTFLQVITHPLLMFFVISSCYIVWLMYGIYTTIKKRNITTKGLFYSFIVLPFTIFALIGHLGNSDAVTVMFGEILGTFYYYLLMGFYVYSLYLMVKNKKRG